MIATTYKFIVIIEYFNSGMVKKIILESIISLPNFIILLE